MIGRRCAEFRPRNSPPIGPDLFGSPHPRCGNLAQTKSYHLVKLANAIQLNKQNRRRVALIFRKRHIRCWYFCSNIEPSFSTMLSTPLAISDNVSTTHSHGKLTTRETNHKRNQPTSGCELHLYSKIKPNLSIYRVSLFFIWGMD